jgi:hypothetical protein
MNHVAIAGDSFSGSSLLLIFQRLAKRFCQRTVAEFLQRYASGAFFAERERFIE